MQKSQRRGRARDVGAHVVVAVFFKGIQQGPDMRGDGLVPRMLRARLQSFHCGEPHVRDRIPSGLAEELDNHLDVLRRRVSRKAPWPAQAMCV